jgi:hypothetical protein
MYGGQGGSTSGAATTPSGVGKLRYRLGGCVGEGATGKVYVGLNVNTGTHSLVSFHVKEASSQPRLV